MKSTFQVHQLQVELLRLITTFQAREVMVWPLLLTKIVQLPVAGLDIILTLLTLLCFSFLHYLSSLADLVTINSNICRFFIL